MDGSMEKEIERIVSKKTKKFKIVIAVLMCLTITFGAFNFPAIRSYGLSLLEQPIINISYLNGDSTEGESGYGIRDNSGVVEIKNSGGQWGEAKKKLTTDPALTVDDSGGADYTTIQEAIDFFKGYQICCDATISVADGTYYEEVDIVNLDLGVGGSLTITGNTTTPSNVVIDGQNTRDYGFWIEHSSVIIKGFRIVNCAKDGIHLRDRAYLEANYIEVSSNTISGVYVEGYSFAVFGSRTVDGAYVEINNNGYDGCFAGQFSRIDVFGYDLDDNIEIQDNGRHGMYADTRSMVYARWALVEGNDDDGVYAINQSQALAYNCETTSGQENVGYGIFVQRMSWGRIWGTSSSLTGTLGVSSPATNSEGNENSYMKG